jgi:hypothetical protein
MQMLMSRTSDTHSHLARRITKKHSGIHTVTPVQRAANSNPDAPKRESPFGEIKFEGELPKTPSGYKSIFGL